MPPQRYLQHAPGLAPGDLVTTNDGSYCNRLRSDASTAYVVLSVTGLGYAVLLSSTDGSTTTTTYAGVLCRPTVEPTT